MAISKSIEERIENVDLLTDLDGTMIREESQYMEVLALMFQNYQRPFSFTKELIKGYKDYKKNDDLNGFYSLFKNCPVEVLDEITKGFTLNPKWDKSIQELKPNNIGVVSRNSTRIISKYLEQLNYPISNIGLTAANIPEIKNGIYTGNVEIVVNNRNLADFINKKPYICGKEEKRIVEKSEGIQSERLKSGLYLCRRKKIF
jgi:phosphoserine phosphatase